MVRKGVLVVADNILVFFVITPLHIIHWRGTWDLWDHYARIDCRDANVDGGNSTAGLNSTAPASPGRRPPHGTRPWDTDDCTEFAGNWLSAGLCCFVCWLLNSVSPLMEEGAQKLGKAGYVGTSRLYMYLYAAASLGQWRGTWNLVDAYSDDGWRSNLIGLAATLVLSVLTRTVRYSIPHPYGNKVDEIGERFRAGGWLNTSPDTDGWWKWCVDQALTQVVIVNLNIVLWRCWWNIMDDVIMPDHYDLSSGICCVAGALACFLLIFIGKFAAAFSASLDGKHPLRKIAFEDLFNFVVFIAATLYWRGFWNLIEDHLLPAKLYGGKELGGLVCHAVGVVGLMTSLNFCGAYDNHVGVDGDETEGRGVLADNTYLAYLCRDRIDSAKVAPAPLWEDDARRVHVINGDDPAHKLTHPSTDDDKPPNLFDEYH